MKRVKTDWSRTLIAGAGVALLALWLPGCVGYRVGSMLPPDITTVYVPTFVNRTSEPQIEVEATKATIAEFQKDGSLRVVAAETADAILEVTVTGFDASPLSYDQDNRTSANEYRLTLTASIVLKRKATDEILTEAVGVQGESTFRIAGDFTSSKQTGLPKAAQDLAHDIVEKVVEAW